MTNTPDDTTTAAATLPEVALVPGLTVAEVHARLAQGLRMQDVGQRILAFYLCDMETRRLHQASGHSSAVHFAEERLGLQRRRAQELIVVGRKLGSLPAIDRAFCEQRIGWSKVRLLARVVEPQHEAAWLERAEWLACRDLALEVKLARPGSAPRAPGDRRGLPEVRFKVTADVSVLTHRKFELAKEKLSAERGRPLGDAECLDLLSELCLGVEADGTVPGHTRVDASLYRIVLRPQGADGGASGGHAEDAPVLWADTEMGPLPIAPGPEGEHDLDPAAILSACLHCDAEQHRVDEADVAGQPGPSPERPVVEAPPEAPPTPAWLRRRVLARDGGCCRNCRSRHRLMVHHLRYRSQGGPTRASNLITVCVACHALLHAGLLEVHGHQAKQAHFVDADGIGGAQAERLLAALEPGPRLSVVAPPTSAGPVEEGPVAGGRLVTLDDVPARVDGVWWQQHAHLIRCRGAHGLEFRPGQARDPELPAEVPPAEVLSAEVLPDVVGDPFAGILGQDALVERLRTTAVGRRERGLAFPHALFVGPPGTGKTTLARAVAARSGSRLLDTAGPFLQDAHALLRVLAELREGGMLFVDEIHAVPRTVLVALYQALAERRISLTLNCGARARAVQLDLPRFTLLAATTEEGNLPQALRSRFGLREHLADYDTASLARIAAAAARALGARLEPAAATRIGTRARGTPREALRLLDRVLDHRAARTARARPGAAGSLTVSRHDVDVVLARLGLDAEGLDLAEQRYLGLLRRSPAPVPLARLAGMLGESPRTLRECLEPSLVLRGLLRITTRGRALRARPA